MARANPKPVDRAAVFHAEEMFFSTTDLKGKIQLCNEVFLRIAEYSAEELLGAPHKVIRHPHMPRCVFRLFWDRLESGKPIGAYVKNMTKSGLYYWVFALALPIDGGYLSLRIKPTSGTLPVVGKLYEELLEIEAQCRESKSEAMDASMARLVERLLDLGFDSYEDFMSASLRSEMQSRDESIDGMAANAAQSRSIPTGLQRMRVELRKCFDELSKLEDLGEQTQTEARFLGVVGKVVRRVALNSSVCASRLAEHGRALSVLSEQSVRVADDIQVESDNLRARQEEISTALHRSSFEVCFARLAVEMCVQLEDEAAASSLEADEQVARYGAAYRDLVDLLVTALDAASSLARDAVQEVRGGLRDFESIAGRFDSILLTTRINRVTGRSMAASLDSGDQFARLLDEMTDAAHEARTRLESLLDASSSVSRALEGWDIREAKGMTRHALLEASASA